jgi:hypothetical protein
LIVLDAFSSDAVPVHLLTRQALQLYLSRLRQDGIVAHHISNRYFERVVAGSRVISRGRMIYSNLLKTVRFLQ